jgi:outer membrane biosynthesis protein TonB
MLRLVSFIGLCACVMSTTGAAQKKTSARYADEVNVVSFEELGYPASARSGGVQGAVVVEAKLDGAGNVIAAVPLSGPPSLIEAAAANARKWQFTVNRQKPVIIVYDFSIDEGRCQDRMHSLFKLRRKNVASITACGGTEQTSTALRGDQFEVVSFEDLKYPRIASSTRTQGLVVVEVNFDDSGNVVSASPLSGPPLLHAPAVDNVKKWKFKGTGSGEKRVLIGYDFSFDPAPCKSAATLFVLRHNNLASITTCNDLWNTH